jgi:Family of unknown function (DUF6445)
LLQETHEIGFERPKVVVIDAFAPNPEDLVDAAVEVARLRAESATYYPGLRHVIGGEDAVAEALVDGLLERAAPILGAAFQIKRFMPVESSFCLVTTRPHELAAQQRLPHFDRSDPGFIALLLYLCRAEHGGTAFFRHRATGFERISPDRVRAYDAARSLEESRLPAPPMRYFSAGDERFERIAAFEARPNRLLIYQGSLLHSGSIPEDFAFSADPRLGRLTLNMFVQAL